MGDIVEAIKQEQKQSELDKLAREFSDRPEYEKEQSIVLLAIDYGRELGKAHAYAYILSVLGVANGQKPSFSADK